ncbi:MAG: radical SAM protein [Bradyrhizobium sp.]|uniref:radical SAM protein n=1 Tax=Bradyrhizobium sp. TaxID=376 RepID=UPI0025BBA42F|nr:radical SAM protein [Bradyrhizobium sp.]MBI5264578.1 radical SAM protein [Bradyrhizobium sp.]
MPYAEFRAVNALAFQTPRSSYVYDSFSNGIFAIDGAVCEVLDDSFNLSRQAIVEKHGSRLGEEPVSAALTAICEIQQSERALLPFQIPRFALGPNGNDDALIEANLRGRLVQLALNVTESCNLRCAYCVYSGAYSGRRTHNPSHDMSPSLARRAIDFFTAQSQESEERYLSLYGGEPFIRFDFVKTAVEYARKVCPDICIAITSNATLLNETIIRFLSDNDVALTLSLDGPKELHDRYRVRRNGRGSFDAVIEKIELIKSKFPDYYSSKLRINSVMAPYEGDIEDIDRFFEQPLLELVNGPQKYSLGLVNPQSNEFIMENDYTAYARKYFSDGFVRFLESHSPQGTAGVATRALLAKQMKMLRVRSRRKLDEYDFYWPNGICIPGVRSLFVSSDGTFYPCEKLYDYCDMSIGNIDSGFDMRAIKGYIDEYCSRTLDRCSNCWAYRLCSECFLTIRGRDCWDDAKRAEFCVGQKSMWIAILTIYTSIMERDPVALDYYLHEDA